MQFLWVICSLVFWLPFIWVIPLILSSIWYYFSLFSWEWRCISSDRVADFSVCQLDSLNLSSLLRTDTVTLCYYSIPFVCSWVPWPGVFRLHAQLLWCQKLASISGSMAAEYCWKRGIVQRWGIDTGQKAHWCQWRQDLAMSSSLHICLVPIAFDIHHVFHFSLFRAKEQTAFCPMKLFNTHKVFGSNFCEQNRAFQNRRWKQE